MEAGIERNGRLRMNRTRTSPTTLMQMATLAGLLLPVFACSDRADGLANDLQAHEIDSVTQAISTKRVGVHATQDYQGTYYYPDGWLGELDNQWGLSGGFVNTISGYDQVPFYYELVGKQYYWHKTGDQAAGSLEDVDLFFAVTHGGITDGWQSGGTWWDGEWPKGRHAIWGMWDAYPDGFGDPSPWPHGYYAYSGSMRLGDDGRNLSIFSTYSCDAMTLDSYTWTRWKSIFRGGLRMACGGHGELGAGAATYAVGSTYATYLQSMTLTEAWLEAMTSVDPGNPVATMSAADTKAHAEDRVATMTWGNYSAYARYRDNAITSWDAEWIN